MVSTGSCFREYPRIIKQMTIFFAVVIMPRMYYSDRIQIHWNTCCPFERFWFVIRVRVNCCYFWYWNISKFIRVFKNTNHFWSHFFWKILYFITEIVITHRSKYIVYIYVTKSVLSLSILFGNSIKILS